jgi:hypothetical protein
MERTVDIYHTSLCIGLRPFACRATNSPTLWHGVPKIVPLYGLHILLRESPITDPERYQGEHNVDKARCRTFCRDALLLIPSTEVQFF